MNAHDRFEQFLRKLPRELIDEAREVITGRDELMRQKVEKEVRRELGREIVKRLLGVEL